MAALLGRYSLAVVSPLSCICVAAALVVSGPPSVAASPSAPPSPLAATTSVPGWTDADIDRFVDRAAEDALARCQDLGRELPADFLAWVNSDRVRRLSILGCRADPLPVLLGVRSLEIDLGENVVREQYPQLAIAIAMQDSYAARTSRGTPWNDADGASPRTDLPDTSPRGPLVLRIPGDPRVPLDTKDATRPLDRNDHIINFLEDHAPIEVEVPTTEAPPLEYDERGVAKPPGKPVTVMRKSTRPVVAADVIASRRLQSEFNDYMAARGHPDISIDCGDRAVHWFGVDAVRDGDLRKRIKAAHELFHDAYRATGRMPRERDLAPSASESMAWFVRNDRERPAVPEGTEQRKHAWPMFPLNAPWPILLMLAADDQPLREREEIWARFRDHDEFRTYGEYTGGIAQQFDVQSARRISPFPYAYGSIQMMWKDGGVCGTMGNIGARTHRICGVPASTAGQPGHCAIVFMEHDRATGHFRCTGGQYATGGDEVTTVHAGWNYDDVGGRRPMVYHQSIAWGVNHDVESLIETLVMRRMWDRLTPEERTRQAGAYLTAALARTPFALAAVDAVAAACGEWRGVVECTDIALAGLAMPDMPPLYLSTVRDRFHARLAALDGPTDAASAQALAEALERQSCNHAPLLARTWRSLGGNAEFDARTVAAVEAYLSTPGRERAKGQPARREATAFAARLKQWSDTIDGVEARQAWARTLLPHFEGRDSLTNSKGAPQPDPAYEFLSTLAGADAAPVTPGDRGAP